jgi:hypothetical protein
MVLSLDVRTVDGDMNPHERPSVRDTGSGRGYEAEKSMTETMTETMKRLW